MRALTMWLLFGGLLASPIAGTSSDGNNAGEATGTKTASASPEKGKKSVSARAAEGSAKPERSAIENELAEMRNLMQRQTEEIEAQRAALREQQQKMQALEERLRTSASEPERSSKEPAASLNRMPEATPSATYTNAATISSVGAAPAQTAQGGSDGPASISFKGVTITPGGFVAAETTWRQRATSADVNTPFTGIPFPGNSLSKVSEFNASGRQSRVTLLGETKLSASKASAYYEADFLSAGVTSNNRQSNSYTLRQRQLYGQVAFNSGWTVTGGQMWSLVTETKKGIQNRQENLPMTIDAQYSVGFSWARQFGFRVTKSFGDKFALGVSLEGPQTTFGGRGSPTRFFINALGNGGGLFNSFDGTGYSLNKTPDVVVKAAVDPGWGHYELFGVISTFRARVFPCSTASVATPCSFDSTTSPSAAGAFNDTRTGGGIGLNARMPVVAKKVDFGIHLLAGDGIGRYGSAQLADVTARPNGTLALIRGGQALGTLEFHPVPQLDIYFNAGVEYAFRAAYLTSTGAPVGYGSPLFNNSGCAAAEQLPAAGTVNAPSAGLTCNGDIRNVVEDTLGFWHRLYSGSKGKVQWGLQYSYLVKNTWSGNNNIPASVGLQPKAIDNMLFTSFRYYLP